MRRVATLDHVVWATPSVEALAAQLLADHGLMALPGGVHPAWGTRNAIVPLGGAYLELVEVFDPDAPRVGFTQAVARTADTDGGLCLWCVRTGDIDGDAAPRGLHVVPGRRDNADGTALSWRVAGMAEACADPAVPFLIQWDDDAAMPGALPVQHPAGPAHVAHLEVGPGGPEWMLVATQAGDVRLPGAAGA